jgi:LPXTG-site transpeptidase (sortase) family protein
MVLLRPRAVAGLLVIASIALSVHSAGDDLAATTGWILRTYGGSALESGPLNPSRVLSATTTSASFSALPVKSSSAVTLSEPLESPSGDVAGAAQNDRPATPTVRPSGGEPARSEINVSLTVPVPDSAPQQAPPLAGAGHASSSPTRGASRPRDELSASAGLPPQGAFPAVGPLSGPDLAAAPPTSEPTPAWRTPAGTSNPVSATPTPVPPATRLEIPKLGIDAPVVEARIVDGRWDVSSLTQEVGHLERTGHPGESNNMVLAGHVTLRRGGGPFLRLEELQLGDVVIVHAGDQAYVYRVVSKKYVSPTEVSVAFPTQEPILTLLTCASESWDAANKTYTQRAAIVCELLGRKASPAGGSQES